MTDATAEDAEEPPKSGKMGLVLAVLLAVAGAGAGFFLASSGKVPLLGGKNPEQAHVEKSEGASKGYADVKVAFVDLPPVLISLESKRGTRHLRFHAQVEVETKYQTDVEAIIPRIVNVMNSYLRALSLAELQDPLALPRLRAQLLRRLSIVSGEGRVRDLLVMEFILN
ncbi:flagellar basal body-associated FliL family protein [Ruegeria sp. 2012CJ41-6]|uniref:Flagellar protein FliL n=1 Tax=Ruegeria spongiae TaxID=2942209 RepID=A0ABT0Q6N9_9RHOB|nr:flagellar basal body-associated FliL family protein [Ruegeria spongiae]MCL6284818.1 flagellar basal body-associated FliL family protein [Ruegeria spongiae]